jgi:RimK family alpha-L-glutamate ligase
MKALIIVNNQIGHNQYKIDRFLKEAKHFSIDFDVLRNNGNLYVIEEGRCLPLIGEYSFIIYLDKDIYTAYALESAGYKIYNQPDFIRLCDDKALTFVKCLDMGINMPLTITPPLIYTSSIDSKFMIEYLSYVESKFSYPFIAKLSYSSLGEGVYKINNFDELKQFYLANFNKPFVFQENVSTSIGRSLRVLIINEEIIGAIERINEFDFRSNAVNSYSKKYKLDEKYKVFAKNIAKKLHIKYAGIDLLHSDNGPLLCEINSNAFFEEFEKTTGINVAYKYLEFIVNDCEEK